jgi:hypothetical protein
VGQRLIWWARPHTGVGSRRIEAAQPNPPPYPSAAGADGPFQEAFDQPEFVHQLQGQGMQVVAAKIADEVRMLPRHTDVDADMSRQFLSIIPAGSAVKHDLLMSAKFFTDSSSMQTHLLYLQRLLILYLHNYNMRDDFASEGVCTMSSISATGASTYNALASLLTPAPSTSDSPPQTAASTNSNIATPSTDPIDTVDLRIGPSGFWRGRHSSKQPPTNSVPCFSPWTTRTESAPLPSLHLTRERRCSTN